MYEQLKVHQPSCIPKINRQFILFPLLSSLYQDGMTELLWASRNGRTETAIALMDRGADIDAKTSVSKHLYL